MPMLTDLARGVNCLDELGPVEFQIGKLCASLDTNGWGLRQASSHHGEYINSMDVCTMKF